ncbi:MAG: DUF503 domain-containing protein [Armatimonadota bacterium]|nr:DUF503 domain-containing protein [Armatimonadota bacterium]MDR5704214.1 DUF503 domain-containing protein [Armatimonadota bacterium]MDR7434289.1 DUF503 domain-containing protein [Armatimonadota bacterium]
MVVGILHIELSLTSPTSLKEKRRILKGLMDRLRGRFNISIAEVDHQDSWQRASLAVAHVSNHSDPVYRVLSQVMNFIEREGEIVVLDYTIELR